ncbi:MAG: YegS/Rv2252/BmrU family lipid kinase, partial [Gammaproteobacteria bacterium]|nr:YegS/Rv2252/BmrU family lipid kinase [Gammaproteobacteria bacterium]
MYPRGEPERIEELRAVVRRLRAEGHEVTPRLTFEAGDAVHFAREAVRARVDLVIAVGGDGTVNEVVNGLGRARWQPRLGIVPIGTANDFAAGLGLPHAVPEAVRVAVAGRAVAVDVARVNRRLFVNVSTGGFGAEATEHTSLETKRLLGPLAYLVTGVREFVELHPTRGRFTVDGRPFYAGEFLLFAVGNARRTGGGSVLTPRAEFGDGKLDLMVVEAMPRLEFLALLPDLRAGTHLESPGV